MRVAITILAITMAVSAPLAQEDCAPYLPPLPVTAQSANNASTSPPPPAVLSVREGGAAGDRLIFLGDSLTAGAGPEGMSMSYPNLVSSNLGERTFTVYGRGGTSTSTLAELFIDMPKPDGTYIFWGGHVGRNTPEEIVADLTRMQATIGENKYLVLSVLPGNYAGHSDQLERRKRVDTANTLLSKAFPENFVVVGSDLACEDLTDTIHMRASGLIKVGNTVAAEIKRRGW